MLKDGLDSNTDFDVSPFLISQPEQSAAPFLAKRRLSSHLEGAGMHVSRFQSQDRTWRNAGMKTNVRQSYPEPPDIFENGSQTQSDIYNRIKGAIEPKDAERDVATINKASFKSRGINSDGTFSRPPI